MFQITGPERIKASIEHLRSDLYLSTGLSLVRISRLRSGHLTTRKARGRILGPLWAAVTRSDSGRSVGAFRMPGNLASLAESAA